MQQTEPVKGAKPFKRLRHEVGLSQQELGDMAGLSLWSINRIERGLQRPRVHSLSRLAAALNITREQLLDSFDAGETW